MMTASMTTAATIHTKTTVSSRRAAPLAAALLALAWLVLAAPLAQAQPLIEQVPDEAALYIGWTGSENMGPGYEGSNLQGIIEQTGLLDAAPQLIQMVQMMMAMENPDPEVGQMVGMAGTLYAELWSQGGAMYILPPVQDGPPIPRVALMWANAKNNEQLQGSLNQLVEMINAMEQIPVFLSEAGDAMVLSVGFSAADLKINSLGKAARFTSAQKQVQSDASLVIYVDVQEWITQVDGFAKMMQQRAAEWGEQDQFAEMWNKLREVSGLTGVKRLMWTSGLENKNWHTRVFIDAPAPRRGLLSLMDNRAVMPNSLNHVPKSATYLQVFSMDPTKMMKLAREMTTAIDPNMSKQMDEGMKEVNKLVGFDMEKQLIEGMGSVWSVYIDPMIAGNSFSSMVMVNELRNPAAVKDALDKLAAAANEEIGQNPGGAPFSVKFFDRQIKGQTITYLGVPYLSPAYMIRGKHLYLSLFPQGLEMALEHSGQRNDSILANPAFMQNSLRLGAKPYTGISFVDLPETAPDGYGFNMMMIRALTGAGEMFTGEQSAVQLPPVGKLMPFVQPAGSMTWVDAKGVHMHGIEPFPGSNMLGPAKGLESTMAVSVPLAVGIMLPALGSAREAAMQQQTMSYGKMLATGYHAYTLDFNQGPADLAALCSYVEPDILIAPNSIRLQALPVQFEDWDDKRQNAFLAKNSSFVMIPSGKVTDIQKPAETILFFQRPDDQGELDFASLVVAYADGSVVAMDDHQRLAEQVKTQTGKTIQQLIQQQEAAAQ